MDKKDALPFFVYGTLLPGQPNDHLWKTAVLKSEPAVLEGGQLHDMGYYPMLVLAESKVVKGRLITVVAGKYSSVLQRLDALEGYDSEQPESSAYQRREVQIRLADGRTQAAWVYLGQEIFTQGFPIVKNGDWAAHVTKKQAAHQTWWATVQSVAGLHR